MKIVIDITPFSQEGTGIGEYAFNIIKNLLSIDSKNEYIFYSWGNVEKKLIKYLSKYQNLKLKIIKIPHLLMFLRDKLRFLLGGIIASSADIFFSPDFTLPLFLKTKRKFVVVHDLAFMLYPEFYDKNTNIFRKKVSYSIKIADKILADSINTKKDIIKYFSASNDKIKVIYAGVSEEFQTQKNVQEIKKIKIKYNLKKYILSVGTLQPRKNYIKLIEAFCLIKDTYPDLSLVIAGGRGWLCEEVFEKINNPELKEKIIITNFINKEELVCLYQAAEVLAFPSIYEGFGIPILEAFASKIPVVCSMISSLPEVAGPAALYFNPHLPKEISQKITEIISKPYLREDLIKKGTERLKEFSWRKSAEKILEIFENENCN